MVHSVHCFTSHYFIDDHNVVFLHVLMPPKLLTTSLLYAYTPGLPTDIFTTNQYKQKITSYTGVSLNFMSTIFIFISIVNHLSCNGILNEVTTYNTIQYNT